MSAASLRQGALGVLAALISLVMVIGSLALSITEGGLYLAAAPAVSETAAPTGLLPYPTETYSTQAATSMVTPALSLTPSPTASITPTSVPPTPPPSCPPPSGWSPVTVQPGDTLNSLANTYQVTVDLLIQANCLLTRTLSAGTTIYVPGLPTPPPPPVCGPPPGWVYYIVQPGDTLYMLSQIYGVSIAQLQTANCLGSSTNIRAGQRLYVPFYIAPTWTPYPTVTDTPVPTFPPTPSATSTATATQPVGFTPAPTATSTSTLTPTSTATATATPTATATATPTATATATPTHTSTPGLDPYP